MIGDGRPFWTDGLARDGRKAIARELLGATGLVGTSKSFWTSGMVGASEFVRAVLMAEAVGLLKSSG